MDNIQMWFMIIVLEYIYKTSLRNDLSTKEWRDSVTKLRDKIKDKQAGIRVIE